MDRFNGESLPKPNTVQRNFDVAYAPGSREGVICPSVTIRKTFPIVALGSEPTLTED
jgi:hypothetical protein